MDSDNFSTSALFRSGGFGRSVRNMFSRRDVTAMQAPSQETPEVETRSEGVAHEAEDGDAPLKGSEPLNDGDTPVIFAGISMLEIAIKADPYKFKDMVKKLCEILLRVVDHKFPK